MKKNNWWIIGIVALVVIVFAFGGGMMTNGWGYRGYGMMGGGYGGMMGGNGMMGGWGYSPLGWLGMGIGMLFMWGIPLGVVALIMFGVVSLTRNNNTPTATASQQTCSNCAKGVQVDWNTCPYCGTNLK